MSKVNSIFERIESITNAESQCEFVSVLKSVIMNENQCLSQENFLLLKSFLQKMFDSIDELAAEIKKVDTILISVKNQKLLRTCFQLITSIGISSSLITGLGISLSKRSITASKLPRFLLAGEQKYEILMNCTDFFTRSYSVPVLKNIIITLHLSDYLASLIQLAFAPLKKPGTYDNFVMTEEKYNKLCADRQKYVKMYNHLTTNCFQPILMKELLVLQSCTDPAPPVFVKRVIVKEMSQRLLASGGLLSLIRCFIESYDIDTGFEWRKIDMICRIIAAKHGTCTESDYLINICSQLKQILCLNNIHYLATAVACVLSLNEKYPKSEPVESLVKEIFQAFDYDCLLTSYNLPGTIIYSPQEVEYKINILHACVCTTRLNWPISLLIPNLYLMFLIGVKCTKNEDLKIKIKDILLKSLEKIDREKLCEKVKFFLFGKGFYKSPGIIAEEYEAGVVIKYLALTEIHSKDEALLYFLHLFKATTDEELILNIFKVSLNVLTELSVKRQMKGNKDILLTEDDPEVILDDIDQQYAVVLKLLSEISTSSKIISSLKKNPLMVMDFVQHVILNENVESNSDCVTVALILLNITLSNCNKSTDFQRRFSNLVPILRKMCESDSNMDSILCQEAISLITSGNPKKRDSPCERAITDIFDELLPVKAHGIIELTKLIDNKDAETISKKHYIFCIFQEQLRDSDSYLYLAAINGLAALCTLCTEDVLHMLCKEFLQISNQGALETKDSQDKIAELRMKIGDIIVKVTKRLGEMAAVHKTILLNTMLCACRDEDPLIRTSALSNLAEISLVLHYKIGSIIYEVLLCIWSIIETDKAVECRRAAVMVIASLIKGLGKETLVELKENLLPIYRTLKSLYRDNNEDSILRLHAQLALEELNDVVKQFLFPELKTEKQIFVLDKP
ncbi:unnamed protein product [Arctia plantaginis]|uniref:Transmembrane and coiled-coil domain-containing protein 7 n=1 Tax=Arctia plantaginis TaxID=874455 RepID=A0A8S1APS9_ARCPL|nr:unnamed protein product [Arctia plantaginis]